MNYITSNILSQDKKEISKSPVMERNRQIRNCLQSKLISLGSNIEFLFSHKRKQRFMAIINTKICNFLFI